MDQLNHLGWVVHHAYEAGGVEFGVRTNSLAFGGWLDEVFSEYRIEDDGVSPYYSVLVAEGNGDHVGKRYHILYEESRALLKTLDLGQIGEALIAQFDHVGSRTRNDAVYLDAALVTYGDVVALIPPILPPYLATLGHRTLDRSGIRFPLANCIAVGRGSGRVSQAVPQVDVPQRALETLEAIAPPGRRNLQAETNGPVRVDVICFLGLVEPIRPYSPGNSLQVLATKILNLEEVGGEALRAVAQLVDLAQCLEIRSASPKETLELLIQALSA